MAIFLAMGIILFGVLAIAYVIHPFIKEMMPAIAAVGTPFEIAYWGLLPILLLVILVPAAIMVYKSHKDRRP